MKYLKKRSHKLILYSLLGLLFIWAYFKLDNWVTYGEITGVIINERTKQPVEGAIVFVHWQSEILKFERYPGPSVYVEETKTDKMGRFRFENSPRIKSESSAHVRDFSPSIGVIKEGFGLYTTSIGHSKKITGLKKIIYVPNRYDSISIELTEASIEEIMQQTLKSRTGSFLMDIRTMTSRSHCFTDKIPKTIDALNTLIEKADKTLNTTIGYQKIITILQNNNCSDSNK